MCFNQAGNWTVNIYSGDASDNVQLLVTSLLLPGKEEIYVQASSEELGVDLKIIGKHLKFDPLQH